MSGRATIVVGLVLILIGGLFLAREVVPGLELGGVWPIGSLVLGVALIVLSIRPGWPAA